MKRLINACALASIAACVFPSIALADELEVLHYWTSGGESKAGSRVRPDESGMWRTAVPGRAERQLGTGLCHFTFMYRVIARFERMEAQCPERLHPIPEPATA